MLTVIRRSHLNSYPQLRRAARIRPSLSLIEESARPSMVNFGNPDAVSVSTRTRWASTPRTAAVNDVASISRTPPAAGGAAPVGHGTTVGRVMRAGGRGPTLSPYDTAGAVRPRAGPPGRDALG